MPRISAAIAVISSATNGEPPLRRVMLLVKLTPTPVRLIAPTISPAAAQAAATGAIPLTALFLASQALRGVIRLSLRRYEIAMRIRIVQNTVFCGEKLRTRQ